MLDFWIMKCVSSRFFLKYKKLNRDTYIKLYSVNDYELWTDIRKVYGIS